MPLLSLLRRLERYFLVTVFLAMVVLFAVNVIGRVIGGSISSQLTWIEEAVRLLNVFLVFSALGLALERGRHVGIDTLRRQLPKLPQQIICRVIDAVGLMTCIYLAWLAVELSQFVLQTGQRSPTLDVPMGWIYAAPVLGFSLLALRYTLSLFGVIDRFAKSPGVSMINEEAES